MRVKGLKTNSNEKGNSYGHMAFNMRATNNFANVSAMAYLVNVFPDGDVKDYFNDLCIATSDDLYALSTLVQWLWRSRIARIHTSLSLCSSRAEMRGLFREWLASELHSRVSSKRKMWAAKHQLQAAQTPDRQGRRWVQPPEFNRRWV